MPQGFKPVRLQFTFKNFADLPFGIGDFTSSDEETDPDGNDWKVDLYPGGFVNSSSADKGCMSLVLVRPDNEVIDARVHVSVRDRFGNAVYTTCSRVFNTKEFNKPASTTRTQYQHFWLSDIRMIQRSDILEDKEKYLVEGRRSSS
jgi:hypothetical protein